MKNYKTSGDISDDTWLSSHSDHDTDISLFFAPLIKVKLGIARQSEDEETHMGSYYRTVR